MTERPSYILFITDQQRADSLGCTGHPTVRTPNIDTIAQRGVTFERFYVASPVCMPNRASLMTCRMPTSHGVRSLGIPLTTDHVTFVEVMAAAGYDTALIGKSHLQNVTQFPTQFERKTHREGFVAPPPELADAIRSDLDAPHYQYEQRRYWMQENPSVPSPFYGFDHYDSVLRHGTNTGGHYEEWLKQVAPEVLALRGRDTQLDHDYIVPQAVRTRVPEEYYSTTYIANQACAWLEERKDSDKPFFLMVSFPDPHHPFNPPGKYWDMYRPEDMEIPRAYTDPSWNPPDYVLQAESERAADPTLGQMAGYSLAVTAREAQEARALTCGMITMVDDAIGRVQQAANTTETGAEAVQIFTSDHGDHLGDHRLLFKGTEQYDTITRVPFIWADPKGAQNQRSAELAQTLDIGTTIMEHARLEAPDGMQGERLSVAGGSGREAAFIQYETQRPQHAFGKDPRAHTIVHDRWRLTLYRGKAQNELFDLRDDPDEMVNLWDDAGHRDVRAALVERLAELEIEVIDSVPFPTAEA